MSVQSRAVAQLGSALDWGSRGRRFKSGQPDLDKPPGDRGFVLFAGRGYPALPSIRHLSGGIGPHHGGEQFDSFPLHSR